MNLEGVYNSLGSDLAAALPLVIIAIAGMAIIIIDAYRNQHASIPWIAAGTFLFCIIVEWSKIASANYPVFADTIRVGGYASFVNVLVLVAGFATVLLTSPYLKKYSKNYGEIYGLLLFSTVGMMVLGSANNLVAIFVGLETMSICLYILAGLMRTDAGGIESAAKYFLLGAFSTGFFLYGIALMYGATGSMDLATIGRYVAGDGVSIMFWGGVALLLVGFLFKVSAVPFHMWTPDVYQGSPTPLAGYMSTASKTVAFAALIAVLFLALPSDRWNDALAFVAAITMVGGNLVAISQQNVKRMLAYSSIAHAGYILVGLVAGTSAGYSGALYYLAVYTLMNLGAFGVISVLEWDGQVGRIQSLDSLSGIGFSRPWLGVAMGVFMFSLTGFPPFGGFLGKYAVFAPAVQAGYTWLVIIGVLASAISAYYYLRVLYVFWMKSDDSALAIPADKRAGLKPHTQALAVVMVCAILIIVLGVHTGVLEMTGSFFGTDSILAESLPATR